MFTVHLCQVEADPDTGSWRVKAYAAIQDVGRAINPPEVVGQVHGGVLQSLGRALGEAMDYEEGVLRSASFLDYELPAIDQAPDVDVDLIEVPSPYGPYGAKGVACTQRIEVVAPDGSSCGARDYPIAGGNCDTHQLSVGADGTVIQMLPTAMETTDPIAFTHTCTWRWWPAALK